MTSAAPFAALVFPNLGDQRAFNRPLFFNYKVFVQHMRVYFMAVAAENDYSVLKMVLAQWFRNFSLYNKFVCQRHFCAF
ncbi:hypothetical protein [Pseudochrobactrum kiredjianiae]|uniref:Transposase n=1 Tax=Pseudochrobactrum kiredjianiae TaxID=386305 RepID=A0ABW3V8R4_9HYPH|nr:hypothetical protein [Pseudochrobactrum kiredjianiae]MDM7850201.1 hypothetical protein [Pseudochrobactrum kiredjianiae]